MMRCCSVSLLHVPTRPSGTRCRYAVRLIVRCKLLAAYTRVLSSSARLTVPDRRMTRGSRTSDMSAGSTEPFAAEPDDQSPA